MSRKQQATDDGLDALLAEKQRLADVIATHDGRAEASRAAIQALEAKRLQTLDAGHDAAPLRPRLRDAADDLNDAETAAGRTLIQLQEIDRRIAEIEARRELARMLAARGQFVIDHDAVRAGERMRTVVTETRRLAEEFVSAIAEEEAAAGKLADLDQAIRARAAGLGEPIPDLPGVEPTVLWVGPDMNAGAALALSDAITYARRGDIEQTGVKLGAAGGWLPPSASEITAERERLGRMRAEAAAVQPAPEQRQPWIRPDTATVALDASGNPLPDWQVRAPHPSDAYPGSPAPRTGWLGGVPFPG